MLKKLKNKNRCIVFFFLILNIGSVVAQTTNKIVDDFEDGNIAGWWRWNDAGTCYNEISTTNTINSYSQRVYGSGNIADMWTYGGIGINSPAYTTTNWSPFSMFNVWIYGDDSKVVVEFTFVDADGDYLTFDNSIGQLGNGMIQVDWTGWKHIKVSFSNIYVRTVNGNGIKDWDNMQEIDLTFYRDAGYFNTNYNIYIDDIGVSDEWFYKKINNISLAGLNSKTVPGSTITYKVFFTNRKSYNLTNVIIYDKLPVNVSYVSNSFSVSTGWIKEFSTNSNPTQIYNSSDYVVVESFYSKVKWIRCKKGILNTNAGVMMTYKVVIK